MGATHKRGNSDTQRSVSIHAPRMERDLRRLRILLRRAGFNPRAPYGARPSSASDTSAPCRFQSTRPVWSATPFAFEHRHEVIPVSIHAPRMERDSSHRSRQHSHPCFNPRAPYGARPVNGSGAWTLTSVSIHAPRMERDDQASP